MGHERRVAVEAVADEGLLLSTEAFARFIQRYIIEIMRYKPHRAAVRLTRAAAVMHPLEFIEHLARPILHQTGRLWEAGRLTVGQEHLISVQMRGVLSGMLNLTSPKPGAATVVIATPPEERHVFGALMAALQVAHGGFTPVYLGGDIPVSDLFSVAEKVKAEAILLSMVMRVGRKTLLELQRAVDDLDGRRRVWIGLSQQHNARSGLHGVEFFSDHQQVEAALAGLR